MSRRDAVAAARLARLGFRSPRPDTYRLGAVIVERHGNGWRAYRGDPYGPGVCLYRTLGAITNALLLGVA